MNPIIIQRMRALLILRYYIEIYKLLVLVYHTLEKRNRAVSDLVKYSPFNQRISKDVNGLKEYYVYEALEMGADVVADYDNSLTLKVKYVMPSQGIDNPIIQKQNGGTYYYNTDALGSITSILDEYATVKNTYKYYSFGSSKSKTEIVENRYQYTSREKEKENELYCYRSRLYNPFVGRFIQKDKYFKDILIKYFVKTTRNYSSIKNDSLGISFNELSTLLIQKIIFLYTYVNNNTIKYSDPYGYVCGTSGTDFFIPDKISYPTLKGFITVDFTSACQSHDDCYGNCENTQINCDIIFHSHMDSACFWALFNYPIAEGLCKLDAETYYQAVRAFGWRSYNCDDGDGDGDGCE